MTKKQKKRSKLEKSQFLSLMDFMNRNQPRRFMDVDGKTEVFPSDSRYETAPFEERIIPA